MIPRIRTVEPRENYQLFLQFDGGERVLYNVLDDINTIEDFAPLKTERGLFALARLDESRTCVYWNDRIDLPSDTLLEYGVRVNE